MRAHMKSTGTQNELSNITRANNELIFPNKALQQSKFEIQFKQHGKADSERLRQKASVKIAQEMWDSKGQLLVGHKIRHFEL